MNTLALPTLDSQLSTIELELQQLNCAIAQKKELKKAIADKKKQAIKVFSQLENALMQVAETFSELGESAEELKAIALAKIGEYFPQQEEEKQSEESLVEFPSQKNDSNNFFSWQTTSNLALASYFNVTKGIPQTAYIGANNKQNLKSVGANLQNLFEISFEIRKATRLTEFNYELKINGLDDEAIGWLTQFDFSQKFYPQFACILQKPEIAPELKLTENNWMVAPGAAIINNLFSCTCHLVEADNFGMGIAKNESGKQFELYLDDWHLAQDFQREADFTYQAIKACNSQKELEIIKNSNQIAEDFLKFVWLAMPVEDKNRIKELCEPTNVKKNNLVDSDLDEVELEETKELIFLNALVYNPNNQMAYCEARNKSRADIYGYWLTKQYKIATKYQVHLTAEKETKLLDSKYQLEIQGISEADAIHLAKFNFLKEIDAEANKELLAHWSDRKIILSPAYQPIPKPTPLSEIAVGDRVHKGNPNDLYEVEELAEINGELMANVVCLYHNDFPALKGQKFTFKNIYLVEKNKFSKTPPSEAVLKLPSGLAHYKEIAQVVLEEISNFYTITIDKKRAKYVSCWNLIAQSGAKAKLYLTQGFEWTIEPFKKGEQLLDCFPEDIADFLANNDVFVDDLYQQIA